MKLKTLLLVAILFLVICSVRTASADFYIKIGDGTPLNFTAGQTVVIPVYAYTINVLPGDNRLLTDYSFAFDFGTEGKGFESGFSNFSADFSSSPFGNQYTGFEVDPFADNYDFLAAAGNNPGLNVGDYTSESPLKLFDLQFDIATSTAGGDYTFTFRSDATQFGGLVNSIAGDRVDALDLLADGGTFNVTAVPEPSSFALFGMGMAGYGYIRRMRKRKKQQSQIKELELAS